MSTIRRQSILSSGLVYFGFALGFLNTYLFTREGGFTQSQYGLYTTFTAIATIMYSFASLGMPTCIYKFYPYYKDNLPPEKNDMMTWTLLVSIVGFILVILGGLFFKDLVIRKFSANSPELVKYYYWIFPLGFGMTIYSLLEAFTWQLRKSVLTTGLKEVGLRVFTAALILSSFFGILKHFDTFIKIYAFAYIFIALALLAYLIITKQVHLTTTISRVTRRFYKKIIALAAFVWSGFAIHNISIVFANVVIAAVIPDGLAYAAIFTLAQYISMLIQAPQRGIVAASVSHLSQAWKDKDLKRINRIYHRSSINQLIFAAGMFVLIWINFTDAVYTFHLKKSYIAAQQVFLFIGLKQVIDMGTGVNSQIIGTSVFWRFDFITGIILLAFTLVLNYYLTKKMGLIGSAIADFASLTIYNAIRYIFLLKKFGMQPFTSQSFYTLLLAFGDFIICYYLFRNQHGFIWIVLRSVIFIGIYFGGAILLNLSPDIQPVWNTVMRRLGIKK